MKDKQRLVVLFSLAVIVLTLVFFALPGQFVSLFNAKDLLGEDKSAMGGYQFIFGGSSYAQSLMGGDPIVSASGIAFLVILVLTVVCYVLHKKSTAILLLAGILMIVATIMLFCINGWLNKSYPKYNGSSVGLWVPYLSASLLAVATIATMYEAVASLVKEAKQPYVAKKETYSYLKNK